MPSSEIYHEEQGTNHGNPADGLSGSDGPVRESLANGEGNFYDGWMKNPMSAMISCNDGFRPFSFYIEVI